MSQQSTNRIPARPMRGLTTKVERRSLFQSVFPSSTRYQPSQSLYTFVPSGSTRSSDKTTMSETTPTRPVPPNLKERIKESYDVIAPAYNNWTSGHSALRTTWLNHLLDLLPVLDPANIQTAPLHALELGCGAGVPITSTLLSSPRGIPFHVTANDISSTQLALAKESLGADDTKVKWVNGDMMALDFPDDSFDVIVALYSVIHLPREEQTEMLRRVDRWLKVGGLVLVNFGAEESEGMEFEDWLGGWMYWSGWGAERSLGVVKGVGLEVARWEVMPEDGVDASFLWVVGRKTE